MKKELLVIADTGVIISFAVIDKLDILDTFFKTIYILQAVWIELQNSKNFKNKEKAIQFFKDRVKVIKSENNLFLVIDYGESEAVILYKDLNADLLLIDDKHARIIAESMQVNCIGTIGILIIAKEKGLVGSLRPIFQVLLDNKRYYSSVFLNNILKKQSGNIL